MKKYAIHIILILLFLIPCSVYAKPTEEEAIQAFSVSFQIYFVSAMMQAFGQLPPGITVTEEVMTFSNVDITNLQVDAGDYKKISGKIHLKDSNNIKAELKLSGGAVKNLEWKIDSFDSQQNNEFVIIADGRKIKYNAPKMQS